MANVNMGAISDAPSEACKDGAKWIKKTDDPRKNELALIRSSAAEYLTFVASGGNSETSVEMRYEDENIWLTQKMMATLYDVSVSAINQHLKRIYDDNELDQKATIKKYGSSDFFVGKSKHI